MKKRKIKTTIEIHQVYVIRRPETFAPVLCSECPLAVASMVTPEEAARLENISVREIYRLIEAGQVHFLEMEDDSLLVCLTSLPITLNKMR